MTRLSNEPRTPRARAILGLRSWVNEGRVIRGELLPSEQQLCEAFQVSRGTVRAALKELEREGLLEVKPNRGRVVAVGRSNEESLMSRTIVLVTHLAGQPEPHQYGGWLSAVESGATDELQQAGLHSIALHPEGLTEGGVRQILASAPMGVIIAGAVADYFRYRDVLKELSGRVPVVVNSNDEMWHDCDRVVSDHRAGAYALGRWLIDHGHHHMLRAWTAPESHYWVRARNEGFEAAFAESGLTPLPPIWIRSLLRSAETSKELFDIRIRQMAGFLVEHVRAGERLDAVAAGSDSESYFLAGALRLIGREPGKEVLIAGYDNHWKDSPEREWESCAPAVTVDKLNHQVGEEMVRMLMNRIAGTLPAAPQLKQITPRLIEVAACGLAH